MKIALCLPSYNEEYKSWFAISLMKMRWPAGCERYVLRTMGQLLTNALNSMVKQGLEWGADYIIVASVDIGFDADILLRLLAHKLPIVGAWAKGRVAPFHCHVADGYDEKTGMFHLVQNPMERKGLEKVAANGNEFHLIRREVYKQMPYPWYHGPDMILKDRMMSEDYYFFRQCTKYGIPLYVDWDIPLIHATTGLVTEKGVLGSIL